MVRNSDGATAPTRRDYVKYGGAVIGGGLFAGCAGDEGSQSPSTTSPTTSEKEGQTATDTSYEVCIPDRYCATFEDVPEKWAAALPVELEMGILLHKVDGFVGMFYPSYPTSYYDRLDIDIETDNKVQLLSTAGGSPSVDKEVFYEANPDVFLIDPKTLSWYSQSWDDADTEEITTEVAPFIGHHGYYVLSQFGYEPWPLMDYFEVIAQVFDEGDRYEAFRTFHDRSLEAITERLPSESPRVAVLSNFDPDEGTVHPFAVENGGWSVKPYKDVGAEDVFADMDLTGQTVDYETLIELDPDAIVFLETLASSGFEPKGHEEFREEYLAPLQDGSTSEISAVENERVYPGPTGTIGPLSSILGTEAAAKQLYPETFDSEEQLFDRDRLAELLPETV